MSLYATPLDLELYGAPAAALQRVRTSEGYQLTMSSAKADDYLRGRYVPPFVAQVGDVLPLPVTGSTGTGAMTVVQTDGADLPLRAYGIIALVVTTGALGVATAKLSQDGGVTYGVTFTITATPIVLSWGVTITFADAGGAGFYVGDRYVCSVSYGSLTGHVVSLATFTLLRVRGVAPGAVQFDAYDPIRDAYKEALRWFEGVRDLKIDPGLIDSQNGNGSDVFIEVPTPDDGSGLEGDRRWQSVVGRTSVPAGTTLITWPGSWTS